MIYELKKDNEKYFYNVTYDKEKLTEILEKLKKYNYIAIGHAQISGYITRFPAINAIIKKRVTSRFSNSNEKVLPETIIHHKENNNDFVTYDYLFERLPDLYFYIDMIVNSKSILDYPEMFGFSNDYNNILYDGIFRDQKVLDGILNYVNSLELVNNNSKDDVVVNNDEYDYKGLNELYKRTLECFKFNLIAIKKNVDTKEEIDGLSVQKQLIK